MTDMLDRLAGAPITWGVDPSPGWGFVMDRDRVLAEMNEAGLKATELGPDEWLPTDPDELADLLAEYDQQVIGGFVPAVLYRAEGIDEQLAYVERAARQLASAGAGVMVLGPDNHLPDYDESIEMSEDEWGVFLTNLQRVIDIGWEAGVRTTLHPHWGMAVERRDHVERLLESSPVDLCLDTGHMFLAGADRVEIARMASSRIHHVHLKDVDGPFAEQVQSGKARFRQSVIDGMFEPLGMGAVDVAGVIRHLESVDYRGWYVLEQDVSLEGDPAAGEGPKADAQVSVDYLQKLAGIQ
jgi:inosose dehydratase